MRRVRRIVAGIVALCAVALAVVQLRERAETTPPVRTPRAADAFDKEPIHASTLADAGARSEQSATAKTAGPLLPAGLRARDSEAETAPQAETLHALYQHWDEQAFAELMHDGASDAELDETLEWFHERLGECAAPEVLSISDAGSVRWVYPCAEGELEAQFGLDDDGKVRKLMLGAHRIDPPPDVREAAEAVLSLQRGWNDTLFTTFFSEAFEREETRVYLETFTAEWGACTFEGIDLGGARGALIDVTCVKGPRLLKVQLDDDDRIVETWFGDPREL